MYTSDVDWQSITVRYNQQGRLMLSFHGASSKELDVKNNYKHFSPRLQEICDKAEDELNKGR